MRSRPTRGAVTLMRPPALQFSAGTHVAGTTYMRVFEFDSGRNSVRVDLLPPLPSAPGIWRITAKANGRPMAAGYLKVGGVIDVTYVPSQIGKHGRVEIEKGGWVGFRRLGWGRG